MATKHQPGERSHIIWLSTWPIPPEAPSTTSKMSVSSRRVLAACLNTCFNHGGVVKDSDDPKIVL